MEEFDLGAKIGEVNVLVPTFDEVVKEVRDERNRQEELTKTGKFQYTCSSPDWSDQGKLTCLMEEVGEVARAILENDPENLYEELVQVAAVTVAWVEGIKDQERVKSQQLTIGEETVAGRKFKLALDEVRNEVVRQWNEEMDSECADSFMLFFIESASAINSYTNLVDAVDALLEIYLSEPEAMDNLVLISFDKEGRPGIGWEGSALVDLIEIEKGSSLRLRRGLSSL